MRNTTPQESGGARETERIELGPGGAAVTMELGGEDGRILGERAVDTTVTRMEAVFHMDTQMLPRIGLIRETKSELTEGLTITNTGTRIGALGLITRRTMLGDLTRSLTEMGGATRTVLRRPPELTTAARMGAEKR